jgi:hypothetical protein
MTKFGQKIFTTCSNKTNDYFRPKCVFGETNMMMRRLTNDATIKPIETVLQSFSFCSRRFFMTLVSSLGSARAPSARGLSLGSRRQTRRRRAPSRHSARDALPSRLVSSISAQLTARISRLAGESWRRVNCSNRLVLTATLKNVNVGDWRASARGDFLKNVLRFSWRRDRTRPLKNVSFSRALGSS